MTAHPIYQIYAELQDYEPKIWRRFQVLNNLYLPKLGYIVMTMFEMQASHLFNFEDHRKERYEKWGIHCVNEDEVNRWRPDGTVIYEVPSPYEPPEDLENRNIQNAVEVKMENILLQAGDTVIFNYDYGDGWAVKLMLEEIFADKKLSGWELPRVIEGEGYGIIEDCGGTGGLMRIAKAFKKKKGEGYEEYRCWLGVDELDLTSFDLEDMNFRLKRLPRIFREVYEYGEEPSARSMKILMREY